MSAFSRKSSSVKSVGQWLGEATALSPIQQARRLIQLEQDWLLAVKSALGLQASGKQPKFAGHIAGLHNGELIVLVDSSATRAKLKLLAPELADALQARGWQVSAIRTQVQQSTLNAQATSVPRPRHISAQSAQQIRSAANSLTNMKLQQALKRLAYSSAGNGKS